MASTRPARRWRPVRKVKAAGAGAGAGGALAALIASAFGVSPSTALLWVQIGTAVVAAVAAGYLTPASAADTEAAASAAEAAAARGWGGGAPR